MKIRITQNHLALGSVSYLAASAIYVIGLGLLIRLWIFLLGGFDSLAEPLFYLLMFIFAPMIAAALLAPTAVCLIATKYARGAELRGLYRTISAWAATYTVVVPALYAYPRNGELNWENFWVLLIPSVLGIGGVSVVFAARARRGIAPLSTSTRRVSS